MIRNPKLIAFLFILLLADGARTWRLDLPFLEPYNSISRQSMCASVARNFYRGGMNLLRPEVDENGRGPSIYNVEFPLTTWLMAAAYGFAGGVKEWAARSVSVFFSLLFLLYLYLFGKRLFSETAGLAAMAVAAFSPLGLALSRSIQPDITAVAAGTAALFHFWCWLEGKKRRNFFASAVWMVFAVATKIHMAHLGLPILFLLVSRKEKILSLWTIGYAMAVSLALLWYAYMGHLGRTLDLPYQPYHYLKTGQSIRDLLTPAHIAFVAKIFFLHLLTPAGVVLFVAGYFRKPRTDGGRFAAVWFLSATLYLAVAWPYTAKHSYYQLALLPSAALIAGAGLERIWTILRSGVWKAALIVSLAVLCVVPSIRYYRGIYFIPAETLAIRDAGLATQKTVPADALVLASYGASPIQLYYADRKGWAFDLGADDETFMRNLEEKKAKGAAYYVTTEKARLHNHPQFENLLRRNILAETDDCLVAAL